jgi:uncharacterized pyridoxamine 5'-phosphate oxidase family protein
VTRTIGELDSDYSDPEAVPLPWDDVDQLLREAPLFWLSTVRPDGRPHVTPLIALWLGEALYFSTGPGERKHRNLAHNPWCALTTGCNDLLDGVDLVVEGIATDVTDDPDLRILAGAFRAKYGDDWHFEVRDGAFHHPGGGSALVRRVEPAKVLAFGKGPYSQTRWIFRSG